MAVPPAPVSRVKITLDIMLDNPLDPAKVLSKLDNVLRGSGPMPQSWTVITQVISLRSRHIPPAITKLAKEATPKPRLTTPVPKKAKKTAKWEIGTRVTRSRSKFDTSRKAWASIAKQSLNKGSPPLDKSQWKPAHTEKMWTWDRR